MKVLLPYIPLRMLPHATKFVGDKVKQCVFITRPNFTKVRRIRGRARRAGGAGARRARRRRPADACARACVRQVEVKNYLEAAHDLDIDYVHTCNYEGKKKKFTNRRTKKVTFFRRPDFKKAFVTFKVRPARRRAPPRARSSERA